MIKTIRLGQPAPDRWHPVIPRFKHMLIEFIAHTRMVKFRTVGWAHWLVMVGFLLGAALWFEAYGQTYDPDFAWPIIGRTSAWLLLDELLGVGTVIGITVLIIIRQLNHPRVPERLSRFSGSDFSAAYFVEIVVLLEGLGMIFVKTFKIAAGLEDPAWWTSFFTKNLAQCFLGIPVVIVCFAALVKLLSGMIWLLVVGKKITWGVAWHRFAAFFNIYFKREADGEVALGALKPMYSSGKVLDFEEADPEVDTFGAGKVEDFSWKDLLDFTTCTECGRCQSQCPAWNTGKPLSPKLFITSLRDHTYVKAPYIFAGGKKDLDGQEVGLSAHKQQTIAPTALLEADRPLVGETALGELGGIIDPEALWSCTTCGACVEQCPVDIEHVDHIVDIRRYQVLIESDFPQELAGLFKNLENVGNPWGQSPATRNEWIKEVSFPVPVWGKDATSFTDYDYLFWVGCAGAFEDNAKKTTKAVAELLHIADVPFMVLGDGETCTGDSARRAGNELLFQTLAKQNIETLTEVFADIPAVQQKIVVTCAHCFNTLSNEYPQLGARYEVIHHTQLLNTLVREKKLIPVAPTTPEKITYHDPCYLGRHNKIYEAPRELVETSGATLTEMPRHGVRSMCCGAGGARMWMEETLGKRINLDRVDEALSVKPEKIATGCPFCKVMLIDGTTTRANTPEEAVTVVDVAQMLLEAVHRGHPTTAVPTKTTQKESPVVSDEGAQEKTAREKLLASSQAKNTQKTVETTKSEKSSIPEAAQKSVEKTKTATTPKPAVGLKVSERKKPGSAAKKTETATNNIPDTQLVENKVSDQTSSSQTQQKEKPPALASERERASGARPECGLTLHSRVVIPGSARTVNATLEKTSSTKATKNSPKKTSSSPKKSSSSKNSSDEQALFSEEFTQDKKTQDKASAAVQKDLNSPNVVGLRIRQGACRPGSASR